MADYEKIMAPYEAHIRDKVESMTWGHLAPEIGKKYHIKILFGISAFGGNNAEIIDFDIPGLSSSPWLYEDVEKHLLNLRLGELNNEDAYGCVFLFEGTYKRFKNDNCRFWGKPKKLLNI